MKTNQPLLWLGLFSWLTLGPLPAMADTPSIDDILHMEQRPSPFDLPEWRRNSQSVTVGGAGDGCNYTSLQAAINATPPLNFTEIRLANTGNYFGGTYVIQDRVVRIVGGFQSCSSSEPTGTTTLNANGNGRVFHILGSSNLNATELKNLLITNGSADNEGGGGLRIEGRPGWLGVRLTNVTVSNNQSAVDGGGIKVRATDSEDPNGVFPTLLEIYADAPDNSSINGQSLIAQNSADRDGGGIACISSFDQFASATVRIDRSIVANNSANRDGGGIASTGCSLRLYPSSPTIISGITGNTAGRNGGGLFQSGSLAILYGGVQGDFGFQGFSALVRNNAATESGGGVFVRDGFLQARSVTVNGNRARRGAGLAAFEGGLVSLIGEPAQSCASPASSLANFPLCNRIQENEVTLTGSTVSTPGGAAFYVHVLDSVMALDHALITDNFLPPSNSGGVRNAPSVGFIRNGEVTIRNSLISGNRMGRDLIAMVNMAELDLRFSTIAGNDDVSRVFDLNSTTEMHAYVGSSIIHQPGSVIFQSPDFVEGSRQMRCVIGHEPSGSVNITTLAFYSQIDPQFADPASGDFRPGPGSPAIDYCDDFDVDSVTQVDFAYSPRGLDYPEPITPAPNRIPDGVYDLGAWEVQVDRLFRDRFEN